MNIVVFGANGKVGSLVVKQALTQGHKVSAFVRGRHSFEPNPRLRIMDGDIHKPDSITNAIPGHEVVISCLGSWGTPKKDILSRAAETIVPTMEKNGVKRLISLTGSDARTQDDVVGLMNRITHPIFSILAAKIMQDSEKHIEIIEASDLDWTILRSPVMNQHGTKVFRLTEKRPLPWQTIHREAVATAMVRLATSKDYIRAAPHIYRA